MISTREALEQALLAEPENVAIHSAYADLLIEQEDPRGEYIRLQLAAEDRSQPLDRLRKLEQEAYALRRQHEQAWLGPLAEFVDPPRLRQSVAEPVEPNVDVTFRRGWIDRVVIQDLTQPLLTALSETALAKLMRELDMSNNLGPSVFTAVDIGDLLISQNVSNLRRLKLGCDVVNNFDTRSYCFSALLAERSPRLTHLELHQDCVDADELLLTSFPNIETLSITGTLGAHTLNTITSHVPLRLELFRQNTSWHGLKELHLDSPGLLSFTGLESFLQTPWTNLEYLTLRLPRFADNGLRALLASPLVRKLKGLDLCRCEITDAGAEELMQHLYLADLEYLNLDNNYLTIHGIQLLSEAGFDISEQQLVPGAGGFNAGAEIPF
jgi:uncharacterized protein (TIGR02996 family)